MLVLVTATAAWGDSLGNAEEKALAETQRILTNPTERSKAIGKDEAALNADHNLKSLAGEQTEEMYGLAADVLGSLAQETGGNPDKMDEILQKAMSDPASFAARFSPEQMKKLRGLAEKLEAKKGIPKP